MMFWFIVLTTVMNNGEVYTEIRPATSPEYNNEQTCKEAGQLIVDQKQLEIGTTNGKAYFVCHSLDVNDIAKAVGKSGSGL